MSDQAIHPADEADMDASRRGFMQSALRAAGTAGNAAPVLSSSTIAGVAAAIAKAIYHATGKLIV